MSTEANGIQQEDGSKVEEPVQQVALTPEEAEKEALRQVEFYFSDSNLPFDKFLWTLTRKDKDGYVPIATLASFKRMKPVTEALGVPKIAEILRGSANLDVDESGEKVKRKKPLVPVKDAFDRSIYAKGFPEETPTLQRELEQYFGGFGTINSVRMRRDDKTKGKPFKGSVFVEFSDGEEMSKFLEQAGVKKAVKEEDESHPEDGSRKGEGKDLKFGEHELVIMTKDGYCQMKMAEKGIDPNTMNRGANKTSAGPQKKFNAFKEMERESKGYKPMDKESQKKQKQEDEEARKTRAHENRKTPLEFDFNGKKLFTNDDEKVNPGDLEFPERSVLRFTDAGEGGNWKDLKETLSTMHPTSFVEFPMGSVEGAVGFQQSVDDDTFKAIQEKGILVGGKSVKWARVDEDRARQFYLDRANFRAKFLLDIREEREAGSGSRGQGGRGGGHSSGRGGSRGSRGGRGGHRGGAHGGNKRKYVGNGSNGESQKNPPQLATTGDSNKRAKTAE